MAAIARSIGKAPATPEEKLARRRENAAARKELVVEVVEHKVPDAQRACPKCITGKLTPLGEGRSIAMCRKFFVAAATATSSLRPVRRKSSRRGATARAFSRS